VENTPKLLTLLCLPNPDDPIIPTTEEACIHQLLLQLQYRAENEIQENLSKQWILNDSFPDCHACDTAGSNRYVPIYKVADHIASEIYVDNLSNDSQFKNVERVPD
jgi:hypothetical protein